MVENLYLAHHGVKGMKWGVRRYQNTDGSLTSLGKKRYSGFVNDHMSGHTRFKSKNGDTIELKRIYPSSLTRAIGNRSDKVKKEIQKNSNWSITVDGKKVGNLELYQAGKTTLNGVWIGINKKYRGRGYASAVVKNVIEYGRESGNSLLTLEVPGDSPDARHIYEKNGYKAVRKLSENDVWGGLTAMELRLNQSKKK